VNHRWQEEELEGLAAWLDANEGSPYGYGPVQTSEYPPRSAEAVAKIVQNIAKSKFPTDSKAKIEIKRLYLKHKASRNEGSLADRGIYDPRDGDDDDCKARGFITQGAIDHLTEKLKEGVKQRDLGRYVPPIKKMMIYNFLNSVKRSAKQDKKNKKGLLHTLCTEELCRILNDRAKVRDRKIREIRRKHKLIE